MSIRSLALSLPLLASLTAPSPALAQTPAIMLGPPTATFPDELIRVGSVRELSDGSVLVADQGQSGKAGSGDLYVLAPGRAGQIIGRRGQGPLEYQGIGELFRLAGDSTLFTDRSTGAWLLLDGPNIREKVSRPAAMGYPTTIGADTLGKRLLQRTLPASSLPGAPGAPPTRVDSSQFLFVSSDFGRVDTLTRLQTGSSSFAPLPGGRMTLSLTTMLNVREEMVLFPDGWIAIAYPAPYHVDWRRPDGTLIRGGPLPLPRVAVGARQRAATAARDELDRAMDMQVPVEEQAAWPEFLPAFATTGSAGLRPVIPASDGRLLIRRPVEADSQPVRYDVIDRTGRLSGVVTVPWADRIVGFGPQSIYITHTEVDGVAHLRRHAWPPR